MAMFWQQCILSMGTLAYHRLCEALASVSKCTILLWHSTMPELVPWQARYWGAGRQGTMHR